jgi:hypothetical protein
MAKTITYKGLNATTDDGRGGMIHETFEGLNVDVVVGESIRFYGKWTNSVGEEFDPEVTFKVGAQVHPTDDYAGKQVTVEIVEIKNKSVTVQWLTKRHTVKTKRMLLIDLFVANKPFNDLWSRNL